MKQFFKRYSFLVIVQTACLALGLWLEHSFIASLANPSGNDPNAAAPVDGSTGTAASENAAPPVSAASEAPAPGLSVMAVRAIAFLWIAAVQAVIAYLVLTRDQEEAVRRHRHAEKVSLQQYNELLRTRDAVIFGLAKLAESRDPDTGKHLERIAIYSTRLASAARHEPGYCDQVTPSFVKLIGISSALHDIGKVGVHDSILLKPGRLEQNERLMIQLHATIGGKCIREIESRLGRSSFLKMAREIAFGHHEHWDGSGYPKGIAGEEIPLAARIVAIADVYDALFTRRIYKEAYPHKKCVELIREAAGKQFDPVLVKLFLKVEGEFHDIARSCRDAVEEINPQAATAAEDAAHVTADLPAPETSLDGKFSAIEAMLDDCAGIRPAAGERGGKKTDVNTAPRESPEHKGGRATAAPTNGPYCEIETEPENVS